MTRSPHAASAAQGQSPKPFPAAVLVQPRGCAVLLLLLLWAPGVLAAQVHNELEVKAAFVYNLTKYVEWPQSTGTLLIGVVGDGPMGPILKEMVSGKKSDSRPIEVIMLSPGDAALTRCHLLFISFRSQKKNREVLEKVRRAGILTVGDADSFARDGGMIGLVTLENHVQIQVNLEAVTEAHLKLSSRLLQLAMLVNNKPGTRN